MTLHKITLTEDCEFVIEKLTVIKDKKHGKYLGKDENDKMLYEELPARIWLTDKGKFDSKLLNKIKKANNGFFVVTNSTDYDYYKQQLKDKLIYAFKCLRVTLEQRKQSAMDKAFNAHIAYKNANFALEKAKEIIV